MYNQISTPSEILIKYLNFGNWNALLFYYTIVIITCLLTTIWLLKKTNIWIKITSIVIGLMLFGIGFWLNPIYQNDWKVEGEIENRNLHNEIFKTYTTPLLIFADPNCSHCEELIRRFVIMKNQFETKNITLIFNNLNIEDMKLIHNKLGEIFEISTITEEQFLNYTKGRFPMILLKNKEKNILKWYNSNLGLKSFDFIINQCNNL